jgi:hypothetical protein
MAEALSRTLSDTYCRVTSGIRQGHEWITDKPIIFRGYIFDVANKDKDNYLAIIRYAGRSGFINPELELTCPKIRIDPILKIPRTGIFRILGIGIITAAKIERIRNVERIMESTNQRVVVADATCVQIRPLAMPELEVRF